MIRPAQVDAQLQAMAATADRANRPSTLVVIGIGFTVLAAIFALWSGFRFASARDRLKSEMAVRGQAGQLLAQIAGKKQELPDIDALYPPLPYLAEQILDVAASVYGLDKNQLPIRVGAKEAPRPLTGNPLIGISSVDVSMPGQPLDKIMGLVNALQEHEYLKTAFVSSINLNPLPTGWNATIKISAYEKAGK